LEVLMAKSDIPAGARVVRRTQFARSPLGGCTLGTVARRHDDGRVTVIWDSGVQRTTTVSSAALYQVVRERTTVKLVRG
jgi:hypothetical protein